MSSATTDVQPTAELLAPAGSIAAFTAAMEEGADAVYAGAPGFNARSLSRELSFDDLAAMTAEARSRGRKLYVAMNSLVREDELAAAVQTLAMLVAIGPHGLIVQDFGVALLARRYFPELELHASTLMSINTLAAVNGLAKMGFTRAVLARELTVEEIRGIARHSPLELEVFIHGAMCFSYSGYCLFSSMHGGRSSLRGQCVQPCRRRYAMDSRRQQFGKRSKGDASGYFFSMNDLGGLAVVDQLVAAGVKSLKVEGRLKPAEYVRSVVAAYRMVLDSISEPQERRGKILRQAGSLLDRTAGRRRSSGFLVPEQQAAMITPGSSGSTGVRIGQVRRVVRSAPRMRRQTLKLEVKLSQTVRVGDRLRLLYERSDSRWNMNLRDLFLGDRKITCAASGQQVRIGLPPDVRLPGGRLSARDFHLYLVNSRDARKQEQGVTLTPVAGMTEETKRTSQVLRKTGLSRISEPRYQEKSGRSRGKGQPVWWLRSSTLHVLRASLPVRPQRFVVHLNEANFALVTSERGGAGCRNLEHLIWALPPLIQPGEEKILCRQVRFLYEQGYRQFMVATLAQAAIFDYLRGAKEIALIGDYTCNALNSMTLDAATTVNFKEILFSLETDRQNLQESMGGLQRLRQQQSMTLRVGITVYGRPPLFISRSSSRHFRKGKMLVSPRQEQFVLHRERELLQVRADKPFSLLAHLGEIGQSGVDFFVLDISGGPMKSELGHIRRLLRERGAGSDVITGNFLGTLH
ncbi:MAG: hypothetical protein CSA34_02920 [Desulfobulbus propionicus]|nr:MAG: hypothetical protein CSA34_02920 [Desulfobulbus propionicus]